ncbi:hypothetical protein FE772_03705 [Lysobacter enzymogenes]|nr:hypothetical protein FE772_03705 [Lysobacter enzymogenes]
MRRNTVARRDDRARPRVGAARTQRADRQAGQRMGDGAAPLRRCAPQPRSGARGLSTMSSLSSVSRSIGK